MFSLEHFRRDTIKIPVYLYLVITIFYRVLSFYGYVHINQYAERFIIIGLISILILYVLYNLNKISYKTFILFFVFSAFVSLNFVVFYNINVSYRSLWIIALIPFVYLYAGKIVGFLFSVYFLIAITFAYFNGFFPKIIFQDLIAYIFSNILITSISYFFVDSLEKYALKLQKQHQILQNQAFRDSLTGVYNRRGFFKAISKKKGVLAILDLDDFKMINDKYGHAKGDEYLKLFVNILKNNLRQEDVIGRLGGDEFVILFTDAAIDDIKNWVFKFYNALKKEPFENTIISVSSGFAVFDGDIKKSLSIADKMLYISKKEKNKFTFVE